MKKTLLAGSMAVSMAAQRADQPATRTPDDQTTTRNYDAPRHDFNWGWLGLLGLSGLAGLKRQKSEEAQRLEARGVNVKTV
jgi:hypothetical protein